MTELLPDGTHTIPLCEDCPVPIKEWHHVFEVTPMDDGTPVKAVRVDAPITSPLEGKGEVEMIELRQSYYHLPFPLYYKGGKCHELLFWDAEHKFCGVCGAPMKYKTDISKQCSSCGKEIWPSPAPAVIVLIHKGEEALLVRGRNFRRNFYGLVAGFVETGESFEEALQREVREEVGLEITNIRYFGSQPWPYPCGIMVGFNADYVSGNIKLQQEEIAAAEWFTHDNLPPIPEKLSIARKLIDAWLTQKSDHS